MSRAERKTDAIYETKLAILERTAGYCENCGSNPGFQLAHVIPQTKANLAKYGAEVIHHHMNLRLVCSLECNAAVALGKSQTIEMDRLAAAIRDQIAQRQEADHE